MEGLMHFCRNWGDHRCHSDVDKWSRAREIKPGEEIPIWPVGPELKILDEICKKCKSHLFIMDEEKCPFCDSVDVESTGGSHDAPGWARAYGFRCNNCKEKFWISESSLKK